MDDSFARDVLKGLSSFPKFIPSKYFYDQAGDKLFQQIMEMECYYLTDAEYEILDSYQSELLHIFNNEKHGFQLIEFGAGDAYKTKVLLRAFLQHQAKFKFVPIDISGTVLGELKQDMQENFPNLEVVPIQDDYFKALKRLNLEGSSKKVVLFLGSNIGNFTKKETINFLRKLSYNLSEGDLLMIGFDLKKDPEIIIKAYNDPEGITARFNLNLLERINNELGGEFDLKTFKHCPSYDPVSGAMKSYLLSSGRQKVRVEALDRYFSFLPWEPIHTEISRKYNMLDVENLAKESGFRMIENFYDSRSYFVDSVWELA